MKSSRDRIFTSAAKRSTAFLGCLGFVVFSLLHLSCGSIPPAHREAPIKEGNALHFSMVFIIHGDGSYLYHDPGGNAHRADEEALDGAIRVAEQNPQAEVFIFHQRPRRHTLLFIPRRDGILYYYRHGRLLVKESYWRGKGRSPLDPEVDLYHQFSTAEQSQPVRLFLYYGHEIPEIGGAGYDASYSNRSFTVDDLAGELKRIIPDSTKFNLVVLSTCFNGTPHTIAALAPYARTIVASPGNLHLSYLDLRPFERLDDGLRDGDMAAFANRFAQQAFDRLTEDIQTAVTIAVYDVDRVRGYVNAVDSVYDRALISLKGKKSGSDEHGDCAEDSAYVRPGMSEGVDVYFRPSRFGRSKHKQTHSGWECWKLPQ